MLQERAEKAARKALEQKEAEPKLAARSRPAGRKRQSAAEAMFKSAARSIGRSLGSKLVRGILGSLLK